MRQDFTVESGSILIGGQVWSKSLYDLQELRFSTANALRIMNGLAWQGWKARLRTICDSCRVAVILRGDVNLDKSLSLFHGDSVPLLVA
jgi:hypothetical protein